MSHTPGEKMNSSFKVNSKKTIYDAIKNIALSDSFFIRIFDDKDITKLISDILNSSIYFFDHECLKIVNIHFSYPEDKLDFSGNFNYVDFKYETITGSPLEMLKFFEYTLSLENEVHVVLEGLNSEKHFDLWKEVFDKRVTRSLKSPSSEKLERVKELWNIFGEIDNVTIPDLILNHSNLATFQWFDESIAVFFNNDDHTKITVCYLKNEDKRMFDLSDREGIINFLKNYFISI